jgi:hypothetical protein
MATTFVDDLVSPLRAVSVMDPALDRASMDVERYAETRDPSLVREMPGRLARWAELEPLTFDQLAGVDSLPAPAAKLMQAFRLSCRGVHNLMAAGVAARPTEMVRQGQRDVPMWTSQDLQLIARELGAAYVYEIGTVAYERAVQGKAFGGSACYTLPQSSVHGLVQIARRLAAHASTTGGTISSAPSAPASTSP